MTTLITVGHGTLTSAAFIERCGAASVARVVDVRTAPGSRRHPHFGREAMERWLPDAGVAYRWERRLGGFRRPSSASHNQGLRHPAFRGYADHMETVDFADAMDGVLADAAAARTAVMCSETLWWRCHRRLIADYVVLVRRCDVRHVDATGALEPHRVTDTAEVESGVLRYPARGVTPGRN